MAHRFSSQIELFPRVADHGEEKRHPRLFQRSLTISLENFFVFLVIILMGLVASFSIGVERGKQVTAKSSPVGQPLKAAVPQKDEAPGVVNSDTADKPVPVRVLAETASVVVAEREPAPQAAPAVDDKTYTVQVASFKKERYAHKEAEGLKDKGYDIFVLPKGKYSILCVGKFRQKDAAEILSKKMRKKYKDCLIRRL